jgi:hypothetical protein
MTGQAKTLVARRSSIFGKIPWCVLLIAYMAVVHLLSASMAGATGYVFIGLCLFVLFAEFFKSGDISAGFFLVDMVSAVAVLILATVLMCYLFFSLKHAPTFFHWIGCAVILGDAVLSPFNAFRTALRNVGLDSSLQ